MVIVEVPLWVLHSNIVKSTWDVESTEIGHNNEATNAENRIFLKSLFHNSSNKNLGRNAIYSVDATCCYSAATGTITTTSKRQPLRFATGGGDGKVRIWSCSSLVTTSEEEGGDLDNKTKAMARFTEKGGYESSSSSSRSSNSNSSTGGPKNATSTNPFTSSRLLATLATHEGASVLCVRWSHSGHYLASAGDDGHVVLYCQKKQQQQHSKLLETSASSASAGGVTTSTTTEHWARVRTCRGHHLDVVGLAWASPDDRYLASCSLDVETPIIIWKLYDALVGIPGYDTSKARASTTTSTILTPFKVLGQSVHTSAVKGIVWDPIGKYLITSGDDPAICVWRTTADWGLEARIDSNSGIFATTSSTTAAAAKKYHKTKEHMEEEEEEEEEEQQRGNPTDTFVTANGTTATTTPEETTEQLANVSLFRRISFSYDGSHVCATNATVKGKNIAAMIAREGWAVSTGKTGTTAAVNLIGHKQPIVASRHLPILLSHSSTKRKTCNKRKLTIITNEVDNNDDNDDDDEEEEDDDVEPSYASIIALGDKRGFVTVWSTKSSRPIFKIQVSSEKSKCTVTDLSWTTHATSNKNSNGAILLVSMLDGYIASLQFTWEELGGTPLTFNQRCRLFRLRYGIELVDDTKNNINSAIRMKYTDETKLLENSFQLNLEEDYSIAKAATNQSASLAPKQLFLSSKGINDTLDTKSKQIESRTIRGKKRIQPVLVSVEEDLMIDTNDTVVTSSTAAGPTDATMAGSAAANGPMETPLPTNPISTAIQDAKKASSAAQELTNKYTTKEQQQHQRKTSSSSMNHSSGPPTATSSSYEFHNIPTLIPPSTNQTFSVTLSSERKLQKQHQKLIMDAWSPSVGCLTDIASSSLVADCSSTTTSSPTTGKITKATLTVTSQGTVIWKDTIMGAKCTALAASSQRLAMGTYDGTIYLYGTTVGFPSGFIVRSLPPLILGSSIVLLQLVDNHKLLVVCANGDFRVYDLLRKKLNQKGSVAPVFSHVRLSMSTSHLQKQTQGILPKLVRAQLTASGIVILLSTQNRAAIAASGSSLQAFFYDAQLEEWVRVADGRFYLSDFYVGRASSSVNREATTLSELDSLVSWTSSSSSGGGGSTADSTNTASALLDSIYRNAGEKKEASRIHCEDRMACSLALGSPSEFQHWLRLYSRLLASEGDVTYLRCLCDVLMMDNKSQLAGCVPADPLRVINADPANSSATQSVPINSSLWWLDATTDKKILGLDRADLLRMVVSEMGRNRELQRLTNEVLIELSTL